MTTPAAAGERFGKVFTNAAMNFSRSETETCSSESRVLESNGTGVDTKVSAREGVVAVVLEGDELGTETRLD